jgi:site-specific recombinase XerD
MSFSLVFGIRDDRLNKKGEAAIFLRYTFNRKWLNIPLKETIPPTYWIKEANQPKRNYSNYNHLKEQMRTIEGKYLKIISDYFSDNGNYPSVDFFKTNSEYKKGNKPKTSKNDKYLVSRLYEEFTNYGRSSNFKSSTLDVYRFTIEKWEEFSNHQYLYVTDMNLNVLEKFRFFLNDKGLKENSVGKYIKTIKSFLNFCYFQLELTEIPISYRKVVVDKEHGKEIIHLTKDELEMVKREVFYSGWYGTPQINLSQREKLIGQIFIFLCSTGFSYTDFTNLRLQHIHIESNNLEKEKYVTLEISRQKLRTVHKSIIPIVDVTIDLLLEWIAIDKEVYSFDKMEYSVKKTLLEKMLGYINKGKVRRPHHPRIVRYVPAQVFNREIKVVLNKIGLCRPVNIISKVGNKKIDENRELWELVTSHTGRRTYVTLSLEQGIALHHLMLSTGHTKTSTLLQYNKTSRKSVVKEFESKVTNTGNVS